MVDSCRSHENGSVEFALTVVHFLRALHPSISRLCATELLGLEAIGGQVCPDRDDQASNRFDRVVGFAFVMRRRGRDVESLSHSFPERGGMLIPWILWVAQDKACLICQWELENFGR